MSIKNPKVLPGPVSAILAERAWQRKPGDIECRTRLEVICDKLMEKAESDPKAAALLFAYLQGKPSTQTSPEQLALMLSSLSAQQLAELAKLPLVQFLTEEKKFLGSGEDNGQGEG